MSQVVVNIDTEKKTLAVEIDGKRIPDVHGVNCYHYQPEGSKDKYLDVRIETSSKLDGGMKKSTVYYASSDSEFDNVSHCIDCIYDDNLKDFVGKTCSHNTIQDIISYIGH